MTVYVRTFQNQESELLQAVAKASSVPIQIIQRAKLILRSAERVQPLTIAQEMGLSVSQVRKWIRRFDAEGILGLFDQPRSGRPREYDAQQALRVVEIATANPTCLGLPINTWSLCHLQRYLQQEPEMGRFCRETIRTILHQHGISFQKAQHWQKSNDPDLDEKKEIITDYYLHPPENTLILCFDQKGPVQFRRRDGYHYRPQGKPAHVPDEYERRGTGYLLAALNPHSGQVWGRCFRKYNSGTVLWFLGWLLRQLPQDVQIVIIWDNASPHSKTVKAWLLKRFGQRVSWQHTPTKAAWLNLIEAWMSMFERDVIDNGNFQNLADFSTATKSYLAYYNEQCHPFRWGRQRKHRLYLVGPLQRTVLWGRACAHSLSVRWARRLAKVLIT
jgi:transposase